MKLKLIVPVLIVFLLIIFNVVKFPCNCLENFENNKKAKKILLLIFSCKKYESRIETMRKIGYLKYLEDRNVDYLVVTGNENLSNDHNYLESKKLVVKEKDTYEGLPYKVIRTFYTIVDSDLLKLRICN